MKYYTVDPNGFYDDKYGSVPKNAIPLTDEEYNDLFVGQSSGKIIDFSSGKPVLAEFKNTIEDVKLFARSVRNSIRRTLDTLVLSTSTINGTLVTNTQKKWIIDYSVSLANWPDQSGWPFIDLPPAPDFLSGVITQKWDHTKYKI